METRSEAVASVPANVGEPERFLARLSGAPAFGHEKDAARGNLETRLEFGDFLKVGF